MCNYNMERCVRLCFLDKTTEFSEGIEYALSVIVVNFINILSKHICIMHCSK